MNITIERVNKLIDGLNHRLTKLERDVRWIRYIGYYMASALSLLIIGGVI